MFLSVFMWNLCKCNCWLITEVIIHMTVDLSVSSNIQEVR